MFVESIELNNYRNYESAQVILSPGVNIFFGDNAQGKTNILESVYVSATSKSHKGSKDKELILFEKEEAHIRLRFRKNNLSHQLDLHLKKNKPKGIAIDSIPIRKLNELFGMLHVVFFSPEDLSLIKNGPAERRRFIDMEMSQLDQGYYKLLVTYNKLLSERNNLLKQIAFRPSLTDTLDVWDDQLIDAGCAIIAKREKFIVQIDKMMYEIHNNLTGNKEKIKVKYDKNTDADQFRDALIQRREKDIKFGSTSVGPHRDDLSFIVDEKELRRFGSQGQQRTAALSLKLSEIRLIEQISGDKPVLLLDDVLSELDTNRQNYLLENISDIQTLISCTGLDDFVKRRIKMDRIFEVNHGVVTERNNSHYI